MREALETLKEPEPSKRPWTQITIGRGFKLEDRILFCRQLATFVKSGVPILHAMEIIATQTRKPVLREAYAGLLLALQRGESLSSAMRAKPRVFPALMTDLVEASEQTGRLDIVLSELAVHFERELAIRRRIRQALTYPALIFVMAVVVVVILVAFVMPAFVRLFAEFEAELPLTSRILMSVSTFLTEQWPLVLAAFGLFGVGTLLVVRGERGKRVLHGGILRLPVSRRIANLAITARWARTLGAMLRAGVPIITALGVAQEVTGNVVYQRKLRQVAEKVAIGQGMSGPLAQTELFPDMLIQMVRVGEETGGLDEHLDHVAAYYEDELSYRIEQALSYLEPAVLVVVGICVGFVAVSLVSTMYQLADVLG